MGGGQNFGPVAAEANEPWFHHEWERRVFGLTLSMGATGQWNLDQSRFARESMQPAAYLASSYYEIWLEGVTKLMLERGLVTREELASGRSAVPPKPVKVLTADRVAAVLANRRATGREPTTAARFRVGDAVRTTNLHPRSHTRLPRYCRYKPATIVRVHGVHVFPDANARGEPDTGEDYYRHWLMALERIVAAKGLVAAAALEERRHEWEEAAHRTPHGQPIELGRP